MPSPSQSQPIKKDIRLITEYIGYEIINDSDQPGLWLWKAPAYGGSEISYESEEAAAESAWMDAAHHTRNTHKINEDQWNLMSQEEMVIAMTSALSEENTLMSFFDISPDLQMQFISNVRFHHPELSPDKAFRLASSEYLKEQGVLRRLDAHHNPLELRKQALELLKKAEQIDGLKPFSVHHSHGHGFDGYVVWAKEKPTEEDVTQALKIDFEPHREENLEIYEFFPLEEITGALSKNRMPDLIQSKEKVEEIAEDVISRAKKYGFTPDDDTVNDLAMESAKLLGVDVSEEEIGKACEKIMSDLDDEQVPQRER